SSPFVVSSRYTFMQELRTALRHVVQCRHQVDRPLSTTLSLREVPRKSAPCFPLFASHLGLKRNDVCTLRSWREDDFLRLRLGVFTAQMPVSFHQERAAVPVA